MWIAFPAIDYPAYNYYGGVFGGYNPMTPNNHFPVFIPITLYNRAYRLYLSNWATNPFNTNFKKY